MPSDHPAPITRSLLLRVARDIHDRLSPGNPSSLPALNVSDTEWEQLQALRNKSRKAKQRRLFVAAAEVDWELRTSAQVLMCELQGFCNSLDTLTAYSRVNSCREIYDDLTHLADEFDEVRIDRRNQLLTLRTEPIELGGIVLGPFDIALHWSDLGRVLPAYTVTAVHPVRAEADDTVTHPHVRDDVLCEGDGKTLITRALQRGELFEFFVLVRQVLRNYDSSSAYQTLNEWFDEDEECSDCGHSLDEDSRYICDRCSSATCGDCNDTCHVCDGMYCRQCTDACVECDQYVCRSCSEVNADRTGRRCRDCIEEEHESVPTPTEETHAPTTTEETEEEEATLADAAVHARRLGETLASA